ncbi:MAG: hypothetical protein ACXVLK_19820, partial [Acidimicrobiales bacterium]
MVTRPLAIRPSSVQRTERAARSIAEIRSGATEADGGPGADADADVDVDVVVDVVVDVDVDVVVDVDADVVVDGDDRG